MLRDKIREDKKFQVLLIGGGVALIALLLIGFFALYSGSGLPKDAYEAVESADGEAGSTYIVNPKYNTLEPANPEEFKKPYCQQLADSRIIGVDENEDTVGKVNELLEAARIAEENDEAEFAEVLRQSYEAINRNLNQQPLSEEETFSAWELYTEVAGVSENECGFAYSSGPSPEILEELAKKIPADPSGVAPDPATEVGLSEEELQQRAQDRLNSREASPPFFAGPNISYDTNNFKQPYCSTLQKALDIVNKGGDPFTLDAVLGLGFSSAAQRSFKTPEVSSAYLSLFNIFSANGFYSYYALEGVNQPDPETIRIYNEELNRAGAYAIADCGIDLSPLLLPSP